MREYIAWVTTSQTMPESIPGIGITAQSVDEDGYREDQGVIQESPPQTPEWELTDGDDSESEHDFLYRHMADEDKRREGRTGLELTTDDLPT